MKRALPQLLQIYLILVPLLCFGTQKKLNPLRASGFNAFINFNKITALPGLSCDNTGMKCIAVGYSQSATATRPLSYTTTDGGISWGAPNQLSQLSSIAQSFLLGISCSDDGLSCTAIGASIISNTGTPISYTTVDGGATWSIPQPLITPQNTPFNVLLNISCDAKNQNCVAVGYSNPPGNETPIIYTRNNNGLNWNYIQPSLPANALTGVLLGVSCDSAATRCTAIGYVNSADTIIPVNYYSRDGGISWSTPTLLPILSGATSSTVTQINCDTSTGLSCIAVGSASVSGNEVPLSYSSADGGVSWNKAILLTSTATSSGLNALHCDSQAMNCIAMGYALSNGIVHPLKYFSANGGMDWSDSVQLAPPYEENNSLTILFQLTCDSLMLNCLTVGNYINATSVIPLSYNSATGGTSWGLPLLLQISSTFL
ncbi:MAG: hypothetical protein P4L79_05010 [Legionella sp.]|uniref:sialidase family protein n=1 Tax=Legionella sp. TaxID=459 RepID=UPI00284FDB0C|nr:hypothetical protein [Legionella sp.]